MNIFRKKIKVLGKSQLFTNDLRTVFKSRYLTFIYKNNDDEQFIFKLISLGFDIIDIKNNMLKILLPQDWLHIKIRKDKEIITDNLGRIRLYIDCKNKKSKLLPRFAYKIENIESEKSEINQLRCQIYDSGNLLTNIIINGDDYTKYVNSNGGSSEQLFNWAEQQCLFVLSSKYPQWKNELAYWNDDN
jgi:hypothetical protein